MTLSFRGDLLVRAGADHCEQMLNVRKSAFDVESKVRGFSGYAKKFWGVTSYSDLLIAPAGSQRSGESGFTKGCYAK